MILQGFKIFTFVEGYAGKWIKHILGPYTFNILTQCLAFSWHTLGLRILICTRFEGEIVRKCVCFAHL